MGGQLLCLRLDGSVKSKSVLVLESGYIDFGSLDECNSVVFTKCSLGRCVRGRRSRYPCNEGYGTDN